MNAVLDAIRSLRFHRVQAWPPALVVFTDMTPFRSTIRGFGGVPLFILLDDNLEHQGAESIARTVRHESRHQWQGWMLLWVGLWVLYLVSPRWRQRFEDWAYEVGR